jgi:hypothetical protein
MILTVQNRVGSARLGFCLGFLAGTIHHASLPHRLELQRKAANLRIVDPSKNVVQDALLQSKVHDAVKLIQFCIS